MNYYSAVHITGIVIIFFIQSILRMLALVVNVQKPLFRSASNAFTMTEDAN